MSASLHFLLRASGPLLVLSSVMPVSSLNTSPILLLLLVLLAPVLIYYFIDYLLTYRYPSYRIFKTPPNESESVNFVMLFFFNIVFFGLAYWTFGIAKLTHESHWLISWICYFVLHAIFLSVFIISENTYQSFLQVVYPHIRETESRRWQRRLERARQRNSARERKRAAKEREQNKRRQRQIEEEERRKRDAEQKRRDEESEQKLREIRAAKAELESYYRSHKDALQHALPEPVFKALIKSEFPDTITPGDAWRIAYRLLGDLNASLNTHQQNDHPINPDDV